MLKAIEGSFLADYVRTSGLLYPIIETIHILGFTILVGSTFMFDLRLLGVSKKIPIESMSQHLLPWSQASFFVVLPTGFLLFISTAAELSRNPVFILKLSLIAAALINAGFYHFYSKKSIKKSDDAGTVCKINAIVSILLWSAVITCGRFLAYF